MKLSTHKLKKELGRWEKELDKFFTERMRDVLSDIIHKDFLEQEEIHVFDLVVIIIHQMEKVSSRSIANLMVLVTSENINDVDKWEMANSINFIRDYLNSIDRIKWMLDKKKSIEQQEFIEKEKVDKEM